MLGDRQCVESLLPIRAPGTIHYAGSMIFSFAHRMLLYDSHHDPESGEM